MNETTKEKRTAASRLLPPDLQSERLLDLLAISLAEDLTDEGPLPADLLSCDVTSHATIPPNQRLRGVVTSKEDGVAAGLPVAAAVFACVDPGLEVVIVREDGDRVARNDILMTVSGQGRSILLAERTALNFLGRLSGIASLTARYVAAIAGTGARMLDTRKTLPGFRLLDKYAVRMGGGINHRMGLYDMALIKDNHVDASGGVGIAVQRVRAAYGRTLPVEVEVRDLAELDIALRLPLDRILLDNMSLAEMREAVRRTAGRVPLEASGNVTLESVRAIAETGVDFISSGALTHSVRVLDVSLGLQPE